MSLTPCALQPGTTGERCQSLTLLCLSQVSVLLYHGSQPERAKLMKQIRRPQGPLGTCPVVVTSFEISMIDRKFLQVSFQLSQWDEHTNIYIYMAEMVLFQAAAIESVL